MAKFNLNLRSADSHEETPIHLVVRWQNQRIVVNTGYSVIPKFWDVNNQRLYTKPSMERKDLNMKLNSMLSKIVSDAECLFVDFESINKRRPSKEEFQRILQNLIRPQNTKPLKSESLFEFIEQFLQEMRNGVNPKTGKFYAPKTPETYRICLDKLKDFGVKAKRKIDFDDINLEFYDDFVAYLSECGYKRNYIGKQIRTLKTFLNEAMERGLTKNVAHKSRRFTAPSEQVSNIYLSITELDELFALDLTSQPRLENVRDLFVFGCYTGLRFSDFTRVKSQDIDLEEKLIEIQTQKTKEMVAIPIYPITEQIIAKYKDKTQNSLPTPISNQKFNIYIKEVAQRLNTLNVKITEEFWLNGKRVVKTCLKWEKVSSHTARRSFATNMFILGYRAQNIMKITGHRTESSFMAYLKMSPRENAKSMLKEWVG
jgi:site-specific recombinase XerD